ncbi:MAG TPA: hypothetical protein VHK89_06515 [Actinomycetota bacterium]|nr:hypothetical protein [Actinomycetota bacterium]
MGVDRDRALEGALERAFAADPPHSARERALFVEGVAARRSSHSPWRFAAPAVAVAAAFVLLGLVSTTTLPGDELYGVRTALSRVGLVESALDEADGHIASARRAVTAAEAAAETAPLRARRLAVAALTDLGSARAIATEAGAEERLERIEDLEDRAVDVVEDAAKAEASGSGGSNDAGVDDSSGPGGGDDSGGGDSSGPGSGGSDSGSDDSSGPGGGDSSGPGSGGSNSGSGSDSSGPGSGSGGGD